MLRGLAQWLLDWYLKDWVYPYVHPCVEMVLLLKFYNMELVQAWATDLYYVIMILIDWVDLGELI